MKLRTVYVPQGTAPPNPWKFRVVRSWMGGDIVVSENAPYQEILKMVELLDTPTNAQMWNVFVQVTEEAERKHGVTGCCYWAASSCYMQFKINGQTRAALMREANHVMLVQEINVDETVFYQAEQPK